MLRTFISTLTTSSSTASVPTIASAGADADADAVASASALASATATARPLMEFAASRRTNSATATSTPTSTSTATSTSTSASIALTTIPFTAASTQPFILCAHGSDVISFVFSFLDLREIVICKSVSTAFYHAVHRPTTWQHVTLTLQRSHTKTPIETIFNSFHIQGITLRGVNVTMDYVISKSRRRQTNVYDFVGESRRRRQKQQRAHSRIATTMKHIAVLAPTVSKLSLSLDPDRVIPFLEDDLSSLPFFTHLTYLDLTMARSINYSALADLNAPLRTIKVYLDRDTNPFPALTESLSIQQHLQSLYFVSSSRRDDVSSVMIGSLSQCRSLTALHSDIPSSVLLHRMFLFLPRLSPPIIHITTALNPIYYMIPFRASTSNSTSDTDDRNFTLKRVKLLLKHYHPSTQDVYVVDLLKAAPNINQLEFCDTRHVQADTFWAAYARVPIASRPDEHATQIEILHMASTYGLSEYGWRLQRWLQYASMVKILSLHFNHTAIDPSIPQYQHFLLATQHAQHLQHLILHFDPFHITAYQERFFILHTLMAQLAKQAGYHVPPFEIPAIPTKAEPTPALIPTVWIRFQTRQWNIPFLQQVRQASQPFPVEPLLHSKSNPDLPAALTDVEVEDGSHLFIYRISHIPTTTAATATAATSSSSSSSSSSSAPTSSSM